VVLNSWIRSNELSIYGSAGLANLGCFFSFLIYTQSVGLLGREITPSQGRCLHTEQHEHRLNSHRHPCLEWDSNRRSQSSSGRIRFMPQTARPLWSAVKGTNEGICKMMLETLWRVYMTPPPTHTHPYAFWTFKFLFHVEDSFIPWSESNIEGTLVLQYCICIRSRSFMIEISQFRS
jgi:hypothetical protein